MVKAPTSCELADLKDLGPPIILAAALNTVLRRAGSKDHILRRSILSFIRLTDNAILAHRLAREDLLSYLEDRRALSRYFTSIAHLEFCITNTRRALRFLDIVTRSRGPVIDRTMRRSIEAYARAIPEIRNTIEHIDEKIESGELPPGQSMALIISDDGESLEIGSCSIRLDHLATLLRRLHSIALELADYSEFRGSPVGA